MLTVTPVAAGEYRIPPELWKEIINALHPPRLPPGIDSRSGSDRVRVYIPNEAEASRIDTLKTCTMVSREWAHLAQPHLYSIVWVCSASALWKLIRTLSSRPTLAAMTAHLVVAPSMWLSLVEPIVDYLPIIPFLFVKVDPESPTSQSHTIQVDHIQLVNVVWESHLYGWQYAQVFRNQSVTRVELIGAIISSLPHIVPFITSFENLHHLTLVGIYPDRQATEQELARLGAFQSTRPAAPLRSIEVGGEGPGLSGLYLFGNRIELFRIHLQVGDAAPPSLELYCENLPHYNDLKSLGITLEPWMSDKDPLVDSVDEGERVWGPIHQTLLGILSTVVSCSVRKLEIALLPQQQEPLAPQDAGGNGDTGGMPERRKFACRYRHTRVGLMDMLFTEDVRQVLHGPSFASLSRLILVVCEKTPQREGLEGLDPEEKQQWVKEELERIKTWWSQEIVTRLGLHPDILYVEIHDSADRVYDGLWKSGHVEE